MVRIDEDVQEIIRYTYIGFVAGAVSMMALCTAVFSFFHRRYSRRPPPKTESGHTG